MLPSRRPPSNGRVVVLARRQPFSWYPCGLSIATERVQALQEHPGIRRTLPPRQEQRVDQQLLPFLRDPRDLQGFSGPVAVIVADADEIIPRDLTDRLYAGVDAPKRRYLLSTLVSARR